MKRDWQNLIHDEQADFRSASGFPFIRVDRANEIIREALKEAPEVCSLYVGIWVTDPERYLSGDLSKSARLVDMKELKP